MDHKTHLSILDQVSEAITAVSAALTAAHKTDRIGHRNQTHKEIHFSKETTLLKVGPKDNRATDTMVTTGSNREDSQLNSITADQHQKHR